MPLLLLLLLLVVVGMGDTGGKGGAVVVVGVGGGMSLALSLSGMRLIFSFLSFLGFFSVGGGGRSSGCGEGLFIVAMVDFEVREKKEQMKVNALLYRR